MSANGDKRPSEATKIQEEIGGLTEQKEHLKAKLKQDKTLTANDRAEIETEIAALRKKLHELATKQQEDETKASRIKRGSLINGLKKGVVTGLLKVSHGIDVVKHSVKGDSSHTKKFKDELMGKPENLEQGVWHERSDCSRCRILFSFTIRRHHCRKCGDPVCDACSKNRIRLTRYAQSSVRACTTCFKAHEEEAENRMKVGQADKHEVMRIYPPVWADPALCKNCFKCSRAHTITRKLENCRTCGRIFCGQCVEKVDVPMAFRKGKDASQPVCHLCLTAMENGVELVDSTQPPAKLAGNEEDAEWNENPLAPDGEEETAESDKEASKGRLSMAASEILVVEWEDAREDGEVLIVKVPVFSSTKLSRIHAMVKRACSELANAKLDSFHYLCCGDPIHVAHWEIFECRFLLPVLKVRIGGAKKRNRRASVAAAAEEAVEAAKVRAQRIKEMADKKKEESRKAGWKMKVVEFSPAVLPSPKQVSVTPAVAKKAGLPPGLATAINVRVIAPLKQVASAVNEGGNMTVEERLKARSKQAFGAKQDAAVESSKASLNDFDSGFPPPPDQYTYAKK